MREMVLLGATGSIGRQALDIVRAAPDRFRVRALTAYSHADALFALIREFRPPIAALTVRPDAIPDDLKGVDWHFGPDAAVRVVRAAAPADVLSAVVGIAGLPAALESLKVSNRLLLANKEALVTGGSLVMDMARSLGKPVIPVDSEHSAIFQCLQGRGNNAPSALWLTASGGPFRTWTAREIENATPRMALGHPTWRMGPKITVDCAGMMNKGLEVIEAHHLFRMPPDKIGVLVHPQSVIHSMVEFDDGAVLAQLGVPDMRVPIGYAMGYPDRVPFRGERLDLLKVASLTFEEPDLVRFPGLRLALEALRAGGASPVILNAANEVAVEAFLSDRILFGGIARLVEMTLNACPGGNISSADDVFEYDGRARAAAADLLKDL